MRRRDDLIRDALTDPSVIVGWSLADWDVCVRQAIKADLHACLARRCREANVLSSVPDPPLQHLVSAEALAAKQARDVSYELECIHRALAHLAVPVVLLKGAAYHAAGFEFARSRFFSDIDILVPRALLTDVESALARAGWIAAPLDSYDQSYYREFTHELPPMRHMTRGTTIDVHHTILPPTARPSPDPETLIDEAVATDGPFLVLSPVDMVLHSATHLFHEGEFDHGIRDLFDLKELFALFAGEPHFQQRLDERAAAFGLTMPVRYARRYVNRFFGEHVAGAAAAGYLADALFDRGLAPNHPSCDDIWSWLARFALFVRGHYLRMPLGLLLPHLARKAVKRLRGGTSSQ